MVVERSRVGEEIVRAHAVQLARAGQVVRVPREVVERRVARELQVAEAVLDSTGIDERAPQVLGGVGIEAERDSGHDGRGPRSVHRAVVPVRRGSQVQVALAPDRRIPDLGDDIVVHGPGERVRAARQPQRSGA
jgi:hypothetical protein